MRKLQLLLAAFAVLVAGTFLGVSDVSAQNTGDCVQSCKDDCAGLQKDERKSCKFSCMGGRCGIAGVIIAAEATGEPGVDCSDDGECNEFCESDPDCIPGDLIDSYCVNLDDEADVAARTLECQLYAQELGYTTAELRECTPDDQTCREKKCIVVDPEVVLTHMLCEAFPAVVTCPCPLDETIEEYFAGYTGFYCACNGVECVDGIAVSALPVGAEKGIANEPVTRCGYRNEALEWVEVPNLTEAEQQACYEMIVDFIGTNIGTPVDLTDRGGVCIYEI